MRREMAIKRNAGTFLPAEERKKSFEIPARLQIAHQLDDDRRTGGNESTSGGRVPVSVINYRIMYVDQMRSRGGWEEVTKTMFNLLKDHRVSPHSLSRTKSSVSSSSWAVQLWRR